VLFDFIEGNDPIMNTIFETRRPSWNQLPNSRKFLFRHPQ
jgi:hypothetical protein